MRIVRHNRMTINRRQIFVLLIASHYVRLSSCALSLSVNECFERVSVGRRLSSSDVSRSINVRSLKQCDVECEREMCNSYAFGIGPKGNSTCEISVQLPRSAPNEDPDFDLFVKVLQCRSMTMCFKRLVNGRRLIDRYIRRTFPCDSLSRCQLACSIEREFICEGFNYRFATNNDVGNSCQLTAMPSSNLDLTLDFTSDYDYDFYERDRSAPPICGHLSYKTWNYGLLPQHATTVLRPSSIPADYNTITYPTTNTWRRQQQQSKNYIWIPAEDYVYTVKAQPRLGDGTSMPKVKWNNNNGYECFVRARTGFRMDRRMVILTLNAPTLYDCEVVCAEEKKFVCNTISYRYSTLPATDNCHLGEKPIHQLDPYFDLIPDRDYDLYIRNEYSKPGCQPKRTWDSDCFERIRSGLTLEKSTIKFAVNADSLMECELICLHVRHFTCRAFSFRYDSTRTISRYNVYNCLLTDVPIPEMDPRKHFVPDNGCELYHRASYGHGCELDQWPYNSLRPSPITPIYTTTGNSYADRTRNTFNSATKPTSTVLTINPATSFYPSKDTVVDNKQLPSPAVVIAADGHYATSTTDLPSVDPSQSASSDRTSTSNNPTPRSYYSRDNINNINPLLLIPSLAFKPYISTKSFIPSSYSGRLPAPPLYSTARDEKSYHHHHASFPISPTSSFGYDTKPIYPRKNERLCYVTYGTPARLLPTAIRTSLLVVSEQECKAECSKAREQLPHFRCVSLNYWSGHCELSDIELRDLRPNIDFIPDDTYWLFSWDFTDSRCYIPPSGSISGPPGSAFYPDAIWSSFTVSGQKCKDGSFCMHSSEAGIWSCPIDNGDWDYCCRPGHHCGFSEGYDYQWCYVGSISREQWRPCNDVYYPYERNHNRALHWPISYLHKYGPPNTTSTLNYQPSVSVVDNFLRSLHFKNDDNHNNNDNKDSTDTRSQRQKFNNSTWSARMTNRIPYNDTVIDGNNGNSGTADLIEFKVIDVTEDRQFESDAKNGRPSDESIRLWSSWTNAKFDDHNNNNKNNNNNRFKSNRDDISDRSDGNSNGYKIRDNVDSYISEEPPPLQNTKRTTSAQQFYNKHSGISPSSSPSSSPPPQPSVRLRQINTDVT